MTELSVIIPARQEVYLQKTIDSVLANIEADTEVIVVLDGCWPPEPIPDNPKVVIIHHTAARGQRASINEAARIARGAFIAKLDAHCAVGPGFDRILLEPYKTGELTEADTTLARMYNLDTATWEPKRHKRTDYMYVGCGEGRLLRAEYYSHQPHSDKDLDESMCLMGPEWLLSKERFWAQGGCDEGHGGACGWGQQGVEVALKAWLSGGRLMVNKRTWVAHWFRASDGGFPYPISGRDIERAREYSRNLWLNNQWPGQVRTLDWLVRKFNPPGWENYQFPTTELPPPPTDEDKRREVNVYLYDHIHRQHHDTRYRGVTAVKMPSDMLLYHKVIWETRPELIVEVGTRFGGSALWLQDQLDLLGNGGRVVTVDIRSQVANPDPRITYLIGNSTSAEMIERIRALAAGKRTMLILDGDHRRVHVKNELHYLAPIVSPGCYLVIEDCYGSIGALYGPGEARDWFLASRHGQAFEQTNLDREMAVGFCVGGWLRRKQDVK